MKMQPEPVCKIKIILDSLPEKYAALAALGIATGGRISEILSIKRSDLIDASGKFKPVINLLVLKKRGEKIVKRTMLIPEEFRPYVARHLDEEQRRGFFRPDAYVFRGAHCNRLSRIAVYHFFQNRLGRRHGTHWMRKTYANALFDILSERPGGPYRAMRLVQKSLDHARITTTFEYLEIDNREIENAQNTFTTKVFA